MNNDISWGKTIAAAIMSVFVFFLLFNFVAPIIESWINLYARFIPERYGGGSEADNPGILNLVPRLIIASGLSAYYAFKTSFKICSAAHAKTVAIIFGLTIAAWSGLFLYGVIKTPLIMVFLSAAPPLFVAYIAWHGEI